MFSRPFAITSYRISSKSSVTNTLYHRSLHLACRNLKRNLIVCTEQKYKLQLPLLSSSFVRHQSVSTPSTTDSISNAEASATHSLGSSTVTTEDTDNLITEDVPSIKEIEEWFSILEKVENVNTPMTEEITSRKIDASGVENLISQIPEAPTPIIQEVVEVLASEPTLQSLGLGSWWPSGWIQHLLNWMHITGGLPWWATIVITTVTIRTLMLPIVIQLQKSTSLMHNLQPQIQLLQAQITDARKLGDQMEVARLSHELYSYMREKGADPIKNAALPMAQAPVFLSFFWGLRGMVRVPIESMKTGGLYWFSDLTIPDPYYALPLFTCATLFTTIKVGTDFQRLETMGNLRYAMQAIPFIMFPFVINFESAILCYWVSTNVFSLIQVSILRLPKVRTFFNIPEMAKHDINKLPATKKKFVEGFKDSWNNMKVAREVNSRAYYDEIVFEKAGKGPVPKTYKYDPTRPPPTAMLSKKKD